MNPANSLKALEILLSRAQFDYVSEAVCQQQIEIFLTDNGVEFEREFQLNDGVIDFFFPRSGLGLEIKASKMWSKTQVYRQMERYSKSPVIKGLLLATGKAQGLPDQINEKPVSVHLLGGAFL